MGASRCAHRTSRAAAHGPRRATPRLPRRGPGLSTAPVCPRPRFVHGPGLSTAPVCPRPRFVHGPGLSTAGPPDVQCPGGKCSLLVHSARSHPSHPTRQARRQGQDRRCRRSNIRDGSAAFRVTLPAAIRRTPRDRHSAKAADCRPSRWSNVGAGSKAFRSLCPHPFIGSHAAGRAIGRGSPACRFRPTSFRRPTPHRRRQDFSGPDLPLHAPCPFRGPKAPAIARFRAV